MTVWDIRLNSNTKCPVCGKTTEDWGYKWDKQGNMTPSSFWCWTCFKMYHKNPIKQTTILDF